MYFKLLILFVLFSFSTYGNDFDIPNDLEPIEGASEILFSYEFDDKPKFIQRINDKEFLIVIEDGEDYITYLYDSEKDTTVQKSEFEIDEDETLYEYHLMGDKLYLYFLRFSFSKAMEFRVDFFFRVVKAFCLPSSESIFSFNPRKSFINFNKSALC